MQITEGEFKKLLNIYIFIA